MPASIGLALVADFLVPALLGPKWVGVIGPLRLLGVFVAVRSLTTFLPNLLTAIGDAAFVMWTTIGAAITMPFAFWVGSRWGTSGIAAAWLVAYPLIIAPVYYRVFRKTEMSTKEYVSILLPSAVGSAIMAVAVLGIREVMPPHLTPLSSLLLVTIGGILAYSAALFALYRKRVGHLLRSIKSMLGK